MTAVQYQSKNQPMPTVSALLGASIDRYAKQSAATAANRGNSQTASDSADTSTDLSQAASEMQQRTDALIASADKLMAGLTDVAGSANATETDLNKGAEGSLPEQTVTVDQIANANPTPAPTDSTADGSTAVSTPQADRIGSATVSEHCPTHEISCTVRILLYSLIVFHAPGRSAFALSLLGDLSCRRIDDPASDIHGMIAASLEILGYHEQVDAAAAEITAALHIGNELLLNAVEIRINDIVLSDYLGCTPAVA